MDKAINTAIVLWALLAIPPSARGQVSAEQLDAHFSGLKSGESPPPSVDMFSVTEPKQILSQLKVYLNDSLPEVRSAAAGMVHLVSSQAFDPSIRMAGVDLLLGTYREDDAAQAATLLTFLQGYRREDFSPSALDAVRHLVRREPPYFDRILRLAGSLRLEDLISDIRPWSQPGNPVPIRWNALLSMARLGDAAATAAVLRRAKSLPLNDDVVYQLFPDLIYTRSPEIIAFVVDALHNNEPNCFAADGEREVHIDCGYRIMEQLAPVIADFPVERDDSGDLKTDDYPGTLERIRLWFLANRGYTILD